MPIEDDSPVQRRSSLPSDRRGPTSGVGPPPGRVTVRDPSGPRIRWDIVGLAFLVVAVLFSSQNVIGAIAAGRRIDWGWAVVHELIYWGLWALATPIILWWAERHRLERGVGVRPWVAHLGLALVLSPIQIAATYAVHMLGLVLVGALPLDGMVDWYAARGTAILVFGVAGLWIYGVIAGLYYGFDYYRRYRREREQAAALELRATRLREQLNHARLQALEARLHPHFLFNALNSISVLTSEDPDRANRMIVRLSDLLRLALETEGRQEIPLREELDFLERYLSVQTIRFEKRLRVDRQIEAGALDVLVPNLILQPLVENAIRHGVERDPAGGTVTIRAVTDGEWLRLEVVDTGPAEPPGPRDARAVPDPGRDDGIGLSSTRERLAQLYGPEARLETETTDEGGFAVRITIPRRVGDGENGEAA